MWMQKEKSKMPEVLQVNDPTSSINKWKEKKKKKQERRTYRLTEKRQTNQINELIWLDLQSNKATIKQQQQENEMTKMTENQGNLSLEV